MKFRLFFKKTVKIYKAKRDRVNLCLILLLTVIIYSRSFAYPFMIGWDDQGIVINNYTSNGFTLHNIHSILTEFYAGQYAPLNQLYYTAIYAFWGYNPMVYHIGGIIIHLSNICLVYRLAKSMAIVHISQQHINTVVASITALLFAVSPINIESVVWISASKVLLYAFFYLLSLNTYIAFIETRKRIYFYLTFLLFILSFGCKEQAVIFPFCIILLDLIYDRGVGITTNLWTKISFLAVSILLGVVTINSQDTDKLSQYANYYTCYQQICLSFYTISEYFTKCILPLNLSFVYPFPFQIGNQMPGWLYLYPVLIPLSIFFLRNVFRKKWLTFGIVFFIIHVLLVSNIIPLSRHSITADRYAYVSCFGIYYIIANFISQSYLRCKGKKWIVYYVIIYVGYFAIFSYNHISVWENAVTLKNTIRKAIRSRNDYLDWLKKEENEKKN